MAWYNSAKDGEQFATASITDWNDINMVIKFKEGKILESDDKFYLFAFVTDCTSLIKVGEKDWKFEPQLMRFEFARKTVKAWNSKEKKQVDREQSSVEKLFCQVFESLDLSKAYRGTLTLQSGGMVDSILNKKQAGTGKELSAEIIDMLLAGFRDLETLESTELLPETLEAPKARQWSGKGGGQTELEKLNDRLNWVKSQIGATGCSVKIECLCDLHPQTLTDAGITSIEAEMVARTLEMIKLFF